MDWNHILNWKLMNGSHEFPGPDGGTCINEAAIVAAGFKYRAVQSASDCPPCFSRVIAAYALRLNDVMDYELRQELLLPYVVRLAGTADTQEIEIARSKHIALGTVRRILPIALRKAGLKDYAARCADAKDCFAAANAAEAVAYAAEAVAYAVAEGAAEAVAEGAAEAVAEGAAAIFTIAVAILDEAICLGKQADPIEIGVVTARMEAAKLKSHDIVEA